MFEIKLSIDVSDKTVQVIQMLAGSFKISQEEQANKSVNETLEKKADEVKKPSRTIKAAEEVKKAPEKTAEQAPKEEAKEEPKVESTATVTTATTEAPIPTKEELRKIAVQAIQKDKAAVIAMKNAHFPNAEKITSIEEGERAQAIELLNAIIAA